MSKISSLIKGVYAPRCFIHHAASLRHPCGHCGRFSTAASRRSLARVSVRVVGVRLSPPLRVIATVSRYLTVKLIRSRPLLRRQSFPQPYFLSLIRLSLILLCKPRFALPCCLSLFSRTRASCSDRYASAYTRIHSPFSLLVALLAYELWDCIRFSKFLVNPI